mgnify:CR=1 FL=1
MRVHLWALLLLLDGPCWGEKKGEEASILFPRRLGFSIEVNTQAKTPLFLNLDILAISHYFNKTASPSPVMFWTVKAPFWYALVAPRPEETAHPLRSRQPPRGCAGQARRDAPTRNECRAHPERPRPALRAGLAAPPTPLRTCAQCFLGRTLSSALLPPPLCCCCCWGVKSRPRGLTPLGRAF